MSLLKMQAQRKILRRYNGKGGGRGEPNLAPIRAKVRKVEKVGNVGRKGPTFAIPRGGPSEGATTPAGSRSRKDSDEVIRPQVVEVLVTSLSPCLLNYGREEG